MSRRFFRAHQASVTIAALVFFRLAAGASEGGPTPAPSSSACETVDGETADALFRAARERWTDSAYPADVRYSIALEAERGGARVVTLHYAGHARTDLETFSVNAISAEEAAAPLTPHGFDAAISFEGVTVKKLSREPPSYDVLGLPRLSPTYSFGMKRPQREASAAETPAPAAPRTIVSVVASRRDYDVRCIDVSNSAGGLRIVHLKLDPVRDPDKLRIRELWIDANARWTLRAVVARNFTSGPGLQSPWRIEFFRIGDAQYIASETSLRPLDYGSGRLYDVVRISFDLLNPARSAIDSFHFDEPDAGAATKVIEEP